MLAAGVEMKVVQETLGRTSSAFTTDTSVYPQVATAAAEKTAPLLFGDEGQAEPGKLILLHHVVRQVRISRTRAKSRSSIHLG
ncbi:hypothetical protein ACIBHX_48695 [Nonomuraea sp. NPDC050536]|uniref:hypothetical protein n=1 Tax=Nonomuraea sp. NPDC050536 TaxID=3364366 RepID=UPI0037CAEA51